MDTHLKNLLENWKTEFKEEAKDNTDPANFQTHCRPQSLLSKPKPESSSNLLSTPVPEPIPTLPQSQASASLNTVAKSLNAQIKSLTSAEERSSQLTQNWLLCPQNWDLSPKGIQEMCKVIRNSQYNSQNITDFLVILNSALVHTDKFTSDQVGKAILELQSAVFTKQADSKQLVMDEMKEELKEQHKGKKKPKEVLEELLVFPSQESYFKLLGYISMTRKEIKIWVHSFPSKQLWGEIKIQLYKGVKVQIITDKNSKDFFKKEGISKSEYDIFGKNFTHRKIPRVKGGILYQKFIIIDNKMILNGSFSCTNLSDTKNHENIVVSTSKSLVTQFNKQFKKYWDSSEAQKLNVNLP